MRSNSGSQLRKVVVLLLVLAGLPSLARAQSPPWQPAAPMAAIRPGGAGIVMADGRVLITGSAFFPTSNRPEIYDPSTNTWTFTDPMTHGQRGGHRMVLMADGRVFVFGGSIPTPLSTPVVEILNPGSTTWATASPMPIGRSDFGLSIMNDGRVFVSGGVSHPTNNNLNPLQSADIYNPVNDTWASVPPMAKQRWGHQQVTLPDGRIMVMGGEGPDFLAGDTTEIYDPVTNSWTAGPNMKTWRRGFTISKLQDGRYLLLGGAARTPPSYNLGGSDRVEIFDPAAITFTLKQSMHRGRHNHGQVTLANGHVLVVGGGPGSVPSGPTVPEAEDYDPATDTWTPSTMLNGQRGSVVVVALLDGRALAVGGTSFTVPSFFFNSPELYGEMIGPTVDAGQNRSVDGYPTCGASVLLDASASVPTPGLQFISYEWREGATLLAQSSQPQSTVCLPFGVHQITLKATQSDGIYGEDDVTITSIDVIGNKDAVIAQLNDQLTQALSDLGAANTRITGLEGQVASLTLLNGQLTAQNQQLTEQNVELTGTIAQRDAEILSLQGDISELTAENAQLSNANQALTSQNQQLAGDNAALTAANTALTAANAALTSQNQQLTSDNAALTTANAALTSQVSILTANLAATTQALGTCQADLTALNQSMVVGLTAIRDEFRTTFREPDFIIPGATPGAQYNTLVNTIVGLSKANQRPIFRAMGGRNQ